jgi:PIN domain nuclease of toxin-antitoxin system
VSRNNPTYLHPTDLTNVLGTQIGKRTVFSINSAWEILQNKKAEPLSLPLTKLNSKWIEDLNIRPETMKLLV